MLDMPFVEQFLRSMKQVFKRCGWVYPIFLLIFTGSICWGVIDFVYRTKISNLNSQLETLTESNKLLADQVGAYERSLNISFSPKQLPFAKMSFAALRDTALCLAKETRELMFNYRLLSDKLTGRQVRALQNAHASGDTIKANELFHTYSDSARMLQRAQEHEFNNRFRIDAFICVEEMVRRLPDDYVLRIREAYPMYAHRTYESWRVMAISGDFDLNWMANTLEYMAKGLPSNIEIVR